jgi:cold shock CspA family protein
VQFQVATDRRDQLRRATSVALLDESFLVSGERREQGIVAALKEGFGFLRCTDRDTRLFFHFNEVLDVDREICVGDEVEFTVVQVCTYLNRFAALENLEGEVCINMAWKTIREGIKISAKESVGHYELKKHKPWFDK